jgi:predicted amidohydrolase
MSTSVRIAAVSVATIDGLLDANYRRALRLTEIALKRKPDIVLLPEARAARGIRNAVVIYDQGRIVGYHYKSKLWPDKERPYRDEVSQMEPGEGVEVFGTRFGRLAILICYETGFPELWADLGGKVDFALTPYNCEQDPLPDAVLKSFRTAARVPSAWADRVGMTWAGDGYKPNLGTAGLVDADGRVVASSSPGVEDIVVASLEVGGR